MPIPKKKNITLAVGMELESPWLGKGKIIRFWNDPTFGTMVDVHWDFMNNVNSHTEDAIIHEVSLEMKNIKRKEWLNGHAD